MSREAVLIRLMGEVSSLKAEQETSLQGIAALQKRWSPRGKFHPKARTNRVFWRSDGVYLSASFDRPLFAAFCFFRGPGATMRRFASWN